MQKLQDHILEGRTFFIKYEKINVTLKKNIC